MHIAQEKAVPAFRFTAHDVQKPGSRFFNEATSISTVRGSLDSLTM
jgi:hypothetical protein